MYETEAFKALGAFPLVQAALAFLIVGGGLYALLRGNREKNGNGSSAIPQWALHDAMDLIRKQAEQGRDTLKLLERLEENSRQSAETLRQMLENSRNNT